MKRIAVIGTQGVPARYGGFESLVENLIGDTIGDTVRYTVYCSGRDMDRSLKTHKGAELKYVPLKANGAQSVAYDIISMIRAISGYDILLVLGVSGCLFLPILKLISRSKIIVNVDGIEHKRNKWGRVARWVLKTSEKFAVRYADEVIADNKGVADYVMSVYNRKVNMIAYGGDHVVRSVTRQIERQILEKYGLVDRRYAVSVCRIEPENNCDMILEACAKAGQPIVMVGNWNRSVWARELKQRYADNRDIITLNSVYDLDELYVLRKNAVCYCHGHSVGGTNPSLVEAMYFAIPIFAYDCVFNKETTAYRANYFKSAEELSALLLKVGEMSGEEMVDMAYKNYTWKGIIAAYANLY